MPWQKGQSGNPGGRAKGYGDIRALARAHTDKALKVLVDALKDTDPQVRVRAANSLLDRGYGKPTQEIDANIRGSLTTILESLPIKAE